MSPLLTGVDILALLAGLTTVVLLLRGSGKHVRGNIKLAFWALVLVTLYRHASNVLESSLNVGRLDQIEDLIEILEPVLWGAFFYTFFQSLVEQSLRDSEALLGETQRLTKVGGWEYDVLTGHMTWTDEVYRIHEFPVGAGIDHLRASLACYHPDDRPRAERAFRAAVERGEPYDLEARFTTAKHHERWIRTTARAVREDNQIVRVVGNIMDVTQRKHAEAALRNSEERFRGIFENAGVGMAQVASDGRFLMVNQELSKMLGYTREEFQQRSHDELTHPDDRARDRAQRQAYLSGETSEFSIEKRMLRKDGTALWVHLTAVAVRDSSGRGKYTISVIQDISQRKRAEEERFKLEAQLRQSQKMEAVGQLAGGVAHDFNNILTTILGNIELSMDALRAMLPEDDPVLQELQQVGQAAERAATLTRRLLVFSRRDVAHPVVLDLNRTLTDMEEMLRRLISEDITLQFVRAPDLEHVRVDIGQIEQVIMNLVVNARDAMANGGCLMLETSNVVLDASYVNAHADARPGPHVLLRVSDTGHGMDAETLERIFEPFFTTKASGTGTGLGLATVHGIVTQVGGHITAYSEPGVGSTFNVYLPAVRAPTEVSPAAAHADHSPGGSETVLVCEDDETVRRLATQILRSAGYTVLTAASGEQALRLAADQPNPVQLLITDVILPGMNGKALANTLAARQSGLRTLFMSGYTANVIAHHGVLDDGLEFLQKPFTRRRLLDHVRKVLDQVR